MKKKLVTIVIASLLTLSVLILGYILLGILPTFLLASVVVLAPSAWWGMWRLKRESS